MVAEAPAGAVSRKSYATASPAAVRSSRKPPPPMLPAVGCVTASANAVATAASTAVPPSASTCTPTWLARASWVATIPPLARAGWVPAEAERAAPRASAEERTSEAPWRMTDDTLPPPEVIPMPFLSLLLLLAPPPDASVPATLRLDYVHSGTAAGETYALDGLALEGPWPGHPARTIDDSGLGKYRFEVKDAASGRVLYSRGFASVYGEWETTDEAKELARSFGESLRFPLPAAKARVSISKRGQGDAFKESWSVEVDPADPAIDRTSPSKRARVWSVFKSGEPAGKVDLLLMGDGYTAAEMDKWHADARRLTEILFAASPFKERRRDFNVWAVDTPSDE